MQNNITEDSLKNGFKLILKTELNLNYIFTYCELLGRLNGKYNVYKFNDDVVFIEGGTFGLNLDNGLKLDHVNREIKLCFKRWRTTDAKRDGQIKFQLTILAKKLNKIYNR